MESKQNIQTALLDLRNKVRRVVFMQFPRLIDDWEDIANDIIIEAINNERFDMAYKIIHYRCITRIYKKEKLIGLCKAYKPHVNENKEQLDLSKCNFSSDELQIVHCMFFEGMSKEMTAQHLGITFNELNMMYKNMMKRLRGLYAEAIFEDI